MRTLCTRSPAALPLGDNANGEGAASPSKEEAVEFNDVKVGGVFQDITRMCVDSITAGELHRVNLTLKVDELVDAADDPRLNANGRAALKDAVETLKGCDEDQATRLARAIR